MTNQIQFRGLLDSRDHTYTIQRMAARGLLNVPGIPKGKQTLKTGNYPIGTKVVALASSTRKAGTVGTVTDRYKQHGYWYYVTDTMGTQRQQDIEAAS